MEMLDLQRYVDTNGINVRTTFFVTFRQEVIFGFQNSDKDFVSNECLYLNPFDHDTTRKQQFSEKRRRCISVVLHYPLFFYVYRYCSPHRIHHIHRSITCNFCPLIRNICVTLGSLYHF